jgi:hypothetical protein
MKTWRYAYPGGTKGQVVKTGRDYLAAVVRAAPLNAAGQGGPPPQAADSLAAAIGLADAMSGAQSRLPDWRQVPQPGYTIVEQQADATYNVLRIEPAISTGASKHSVPPTIGLSAPTSRVSADPAAGRRTRRSRFATLRLQIPLRFQSRRSGIGTAARPIPFKAACTRCCEAE